MTSTWLIMRSSLLWQYIFILSPQITDQDAMDIVMPFHCWSIYPKYLITCVSRKTSNFDVTIKNVKLYFIQGATLQSAGPFLSQVATFTSRSPSNVTILSPINTTTTLPSSGSAFTSTVHSTNQIHLQPVQQQITLTALPDKPIIQNMANIAKPSPTKAGKTMTTWNAHNVLFFYQLSIVKTRIQEWKDGNL